MVSPFNHKAKLWIEGRNSWQLAVSNWQEKIESQRNFALETQYSKIAWFHCASLGEFEQGRPVIEKFRETFPAYKIVLTFFSPSGYEVRKDYTGADFICYLPSDTPSNATDFIEKINPSIAFFVKYEFWYNYLRILHEKQIPVISFSAIFRPNQIFFKGYGGFYRNILTYFDYIFVQNQSSLDLLQNIGLQKVTVGGDTRFDRVKQIANARKSLPIIEQFKDGKPLLIIGSCWQEDFVVIVPFLNNFTKDLSVIIAPHEIHEVEIESWRKQLKGSSVRYSEISTDNSQYLTSNTLIIDNIGMLSSLYQYADFAWIGGSYGKGLHNILEAATFGLPIFFGDRNYHKFQEAIDLEQLTGAKAINNSDEFALEFQKLYSDIELRNQQSTIIRKYVEDNLGGTDKVIKYAVEVLSI
jgi:3-deoxy-D-manno-octulosonic-acid transferase